MFTNDTHTLKKVVLFFQLLISKINCFLQVSNKYCRTCVFTLQTIFLSGLEEGPIIPVIVNMRI